jgi:hypothetical protein
MLYIHIKTQEGTKIGIQSCITAMFQLQRIYISELDRKMVMNKEYGWVWKKMLLAYPKGCDSRGTETPTDTHRHLSGYNEVFSGDGIDFVGRRGTR